MNQQNGDVLSRLSDIMLGQRIIDQRRAEIDQFLSMMSGFLRNRKEELTFVRYTQILGDGFFLAVTQTKRRLTLTTNSGLRSNFREITAAALPIELIPRVYAQIPYAVREICRYAGIPESDIAKFLEPYANEGAKARDNQ